MIGATVSHYRILEKLGGGGMGVVYKAEDLKLGRAVALKFLPPELSHDEAAKERFIREARAASALDHPNICTIHEIGEADDGRLFIAMACYAGETLKKRIERGPLPIAEATRIAAEIAAGLARAHEQGIVHRDIKPANIMLLDDGGVKIVDFGLAKLASEVSITGTGQIVGTPAYMSPEQIRGGDVNERADLWALGVVLYEMLTGEKPHGNEPVDTYRGVVPEDVKRVLAKLLQRDSSRRYGNASEVSADLRSWSNDSQETTARFSSRPRFAGRSRLLAVAFIITLALGVTFAIKRNFTPAAVQARPVNTIAVFPFAVRGDPRLNYLREGMVDLLSKRMDGVTGIRMVHPETIFSSVRRKGEIDREAARALAAQVGASHFILGSIVESGGSIRVTAALMDDDGEQQTSAQATAASDKELFHVVDQLASSLVVFRPLTSDVRLAKVAALNTRSFDALKAYLDGEREYRAGRWNQAEELFNKAVQFDPDFALAWYRLSMAQCWAFKAEQALTSNQKALQLVDRLSEREQRLLRGWDAFLRGYGGEAERILLQATTLYPNDVEAWNLLGETQFHLNSSRGRRFADARESNERLLQLEPDSVEALGHLTFLAIHERDTAELDRLSRKFLELYPDGSLEIRSARQFFLGDRSALVEDLFRSGRMGSMTFEMLWWPLLERDFDTFDRVNQWDLQHERLDRRAEGLTRAAQVDAGRGKWRQAREKLKQADRLDRSRALPGRVRLYTAPFFPMDRSELARIRRELQAWRVEDRTGRDRVRGGPFHAHIRAFLIGLVEARLGNRDAVQQQIVTLRTLPALPATAGSFVDDCIRILEALSAAEPRRALQQITEARLATVYFSLYTTPFQLDPLALFLRAELLDRNGIPDHAARWYEATLDWDGPVENFSYRAITHLRLAECYERLGRKEDAAHQYTDFIDLWKDCDPELRPAVEEAKRRLDALRNARS